MRKNFKAWLINTTLAFSLPSHAIKLNLAPCQEHSCTRALITVFASGGDIPTAIKTFYEHGGVDDEVSSDIGNRFRSALASKGFPNSAALFSALNIHPKATPEKMASIAEQAKKWDEIKGQVMMGKPKGVHFEYIIDLTGQVFIFSFEETQAISQALGFGAKFLDSGLLATFVLPEGILDVHGEKVPVHWHVDKGRFFIARQKDGDYYLVADSEPTRSARERGLRFPSDVVLASFLPPELRAKTHLTKLRVNPNSPEQ